MDVALFYASPERNRKRRNPEVSNYIFSEHWDSGKPRRPANEVNGTEWAASEPSEHNLNAGLESEP